MVPALGYVICILAPSFDPPTVNGTCAAPVVRTGPALFAHPPPYVCAYVRRSLSLSLCASALPWADDCLYAD
jgi:hypothetical protein